jgi:D-methionine transport system substrate-binding protein
MSLRRTFLRPLAAAAAALTAGVGLVACGTDSGADDDTIHVGTSPGPYSVLFQEGVDPILTDAGYTVEYTDFTDLQQADVAVSEGSVDLNVDQHTSYMENFNNETGSDLAAITPIPTVPAGLYSERHDGLDAVADGHTVGIPADASNQARAFLMLADAGWITLDPDANPGLLTSADIQDNPNNLDIQTMDSATIPRSLADLDWGVIPGSISYSSGVDQQLQYFQEDLRPELILQAVVRSEDADSEWAQAVVDAYNDPAFHDFLAEENENDYWFVPEEIVPAE